MNLLNLTVANLRMAYGMPLYRLCLVGFKVWILVEIKDDVSEKLYVYDRLM